MKLGMSVWPLRGACVLALMAFQAGCGSAPEKPAAGEAASKSASEGSDSAGAAENSAEGGELEGPFVLGDLIEPFDPPPLEELIAAHEWVDRPVVDPLQALVEKQAGEPEPISDRDALGLRNDSPESNEKILAALSRVRVPKEGEHYGDEQGVDWEAEIALCSTSDINSSNPVLSSSVSESEVNGLTAFGLFSFDWRLQPFAVADSVASWQTSDDGLYDKVVIRDDLTWSDGEPITAHDVVFSQRLIMSSQVPIPAVRQGVNELRWIEAYDDHTLVYFQKRALATNVWNLNFPVVPKHVYEKSVADDPTLVRSKHHVEYEDKPVLGGPYTIARRNRGQEVLLERRESYYMHDGVQVRDKPFFKRVRFKVIPDQAVAMLAIKKGDLDTLQLLDPKLWTTQTTDDDFYRRNTKVQASLWLTWSFQWNLEDNPFFDDLKVRQAMGAAFDYEELLENLRFGLDRPGVGIFHPESLWCPDPPPEPGKQDLARARRLLTEAGWRDTDGDGVLDKEGVPFEFTMICRNQQWRVDVCNLMAENLGRLGVICTVQPLEATVVQNKLLDHKFQAAFGGWSTGADPDTAENIWGTGKGRNFGHYSNAEVDRLFDEGKKLFDIDERRKRYQQIHTLIWEDQPYTWLFHQNAFYTFSKELRGYNFSPRGPYSFGPGFSSFYQPAGL